MKKLILTFFAIFFISNICNAQTNIEKNLLNNLIEQEEFTFISEITHRDFKKALKKPSSVHDVALIDSNPTSYPIYKLNIRNPTVFDHVENSKTTMETIEIVFKNKELSVWGSNTRSYNFKSYTLQKIEGKKGKKTLVIRPNERGWERREIVLEIYPNGKAYLSGFSKSIFSGYIMKNEEEEEKEEKAIK